MSHTPPYKYLPAIIGFLWLLVLVSCKKEHSCEGNCNVIMAPSLPADTVPSSPLPIPPSTDTSLFPVLLPACTLCGEDSAQKAQSWSFKYGNTYLCGSITEARFIGGQSTITFFGPSSCSPDTGLRMTVYFSEPLDGNKSNITTSNVAFYYYDSKAQKSILISGASQAFYVTIISYASSTQIATGTFSGTVFTSNADSTFVKNGSFNVKLE